MTLKAEVFNMTSMQCLRLSASFTVESRRFETRHSGKMETWVNLARKKRSVMIASENPHMRARVTNSPQ